LGRGDSIVPIPGTKRRVYLEENAGAVDVELSDIDMARLEAHYALKPCPDRATTKSSWRGLIADLKRAKQFELGD
jgi:diketogulonate reductase-like aldo/keto reductase